MVGMPGAECRVCADPRVHDINRALEGRSINDVAAAFGVARTTMQRHAAHRARPDTSPRPAQAEPARRACLVCRSPKRAEIEAAMLRGESAEAIEAQGHGPSADTIRRHAACIAEDLRASREGHAAEFVAVARKGIEELLELARELVDDAREEGTIRERAASIAALTRAVELLGKITGELGPDVEVRVLELPAWAAIQQILMRALRPHPEAYRAVIDALRGLEDGAPALPPAEPA